MYDNRRIRVEYVSKFIRIFYATIQKRTFSILVFFWDRPADYKKTFFHSSEIVILKKLPIPL